MSNSSSQRGGLSLTFERRAPDELDPLEIVQHLEGESPYVYHETPDATVLACGVVHEWSGRGETTLAELFERARGKWQVDTLGDDALEALQLPFELAFAPKKSPDRVWSSHPRMRLACPRLSLRWSRGVLDIVDVSPPDAADSSSDLLDVEHLSTLSSPPSRLGEASESDALELQPLDVEDYRAAVTRAIEATTSEDSLRKVVVARALDVRSSRQWAPSRILSTLGQRHGDSRRFAIVPTAEAPTFLGASPERLIQLRGGRAETMALAGTARRQGDAPEATEQRLMASDKDRDEHAYVVDMIAETLQTLGGTLEVPDSPRVAFTPDVAHLETSIAADMPASTHLAELVDALHPTPAVCGTPTERARRMIDTIEPFDRGLYTGVVGWMNLSGEGDATVALRCGVLEEHRARLFAGGGITAESDIEAEFEETTSKFQTMLHPLRRPHR